MLAPLASVFVFQAAFNHLNVGIRYLLPLFPFLFILVAAVFSWAPVRFGRALAAGVLVFYAATAWWVHPGSLAYFNLAAGGPAAGHRWLLDSNLDWGQDLYRLPAALQELEIDEPIHLLYFGHVHPHLYGISYRLAPRTPVEGVVAVSVSYLKGFAYPATTPSGALSPVRADHLLWLRDLEPVARLGSIWIYDTRAHDRAP